MTMKQIAILPRASFPADSAAKRDARLPALPETPLVSIVTPSYNSGRFIAETLRSIRDQEYPRVEHIVVDGGSTDETEHVLSQFPSVTVVKQAPFGMCDKVNLGFSLARGEVVAWVNADDFYLPGAILNAVNALKNNPDVGLVYCNDLRVNDPGMEIRRIVCHQTGFEELVHDQNYISNPTAFFRRECLRAVGPVDRRFPLVSDWDLWIRVSRHFPVLYVDGWWAAFREHEGQASDAHRFTAWLQGRRMLRSHGAPFLPLSAGYWRRMGSRASTMIRKRAGRAVNSGLRAITDSAAR
jgi:glycosyltransferase involved in cell wall biosynthesis